jgi:hypothetical protein
MKLILAAAALWFGVHWFYIVAMAAKEKLRSGQMKSLYWKVMLFPAAVFGVLLDVAFNVTFGVILFRELPQELLFSSRVQRHYKTPGGRGRMAEWWALRLNEVDAAHIHEPRE